MTKELFTTEELLEIYFESCDEIAKAFEEYMWFNEKAHTFNGYWIADDIGGIYEVSETYWGMGDMVYVLQNKPNPDRVMEWYLYTVEDCSFDETKIRYNLKNFLSLNTKQ